MSAASEFVSNEISPQADRPEIHSIPGRLSSEHGQLAVAHDNQVAPSVVQGDVVHSTAASRKAAREQALGHGLIHQEPPQAPPQAPLLSAQIAQINLAEQSIREMIMQFVVAGIESNKLQSAKFADDRRKAVVSAISMPDGLPAEQAVSTNSAAAATD